MNTQAATADTSPVEKYRNNFLREVETHVEDGEWIKMCMQCGVCSGSCPLGDAWTHPPQELFMMIRAGQRDEVLRSDSMWMCTSCYNCITRCPRGLPITHIMHGLANYANRLGLAPKMNPTRKFAKIFWDNIAATGRVNETKLSIKLYFMDGLLSGVKRAFAMRNVGLGMLRTGRLNPLALFRQGGIKHKRELHSILAKAHEIENRRKGYSSKP